MRILEAGHYYAAKGPTQWSVKGWQIMKTFQGDGDRTLLFVDDVHLLDDLREEEANLAVVEFRPSPDYFIAESEIVPEARMILSRLTALRSKKRARQNGQGRWFCSGFPLTDDNGFPLCVLLDAGLTLRKRALGFRQGINVLPGFYEAEQRQLRRLIAKVIPDFHLETVLYDLNGRIWRIESETD